MFFGLSLMFNVVFTPGQIHLRQTVETLPLGTSSVTKLENIFLLRKFKQINKMYVQLRVYRIITNNLCVYLLETTHSI